MAVFAGLLTVLAMVSGLVTADVSQVAHGRASPDEASATGQCLQGARIDCNASSLGGSANIYRSLGATQPASVEPMRSTLRIAANADGVAATTRRRIRRSMDRAGSRLAERPAVEHRR